MICENCGGDFADWAPKCPYCGAMNYQGAQREYMDRLEHVRQDMEAIPEQSEAHYQKGVGSTLKRLGLLLAALAVAAGVISGLFFAWNRYEQRQTEKMVMRRQTWEAEIFPQLDAWYAQGDYQKIIDLEWQLFEEDHEFGIYSWEHYRFVMDYYISYADCLYLSEQLENGAAPTVDMVAMALKGSLYLYYDVTEEKLAEEVAEQEAWGYGLTKEEGDQVRAYQKQAEKTLFADLELTEEEAEKLYRQCLNEDGYMESGPCFEYAETMMEHREWEE